MIKLFISTLAAFFFATASFANPDDIIGIWQNGSGKGHIQVYKQNGKFYGKIVWLKTPNYDDGTPKLDKKNSNEKLRSKPIMGLTILRDFTYDDNEWTGGRIYNPEDGKEYKAYMKLKDRKTLAVRGYIGFSFIGKTDTWTRIK